MAARSSWLRGTSTSPATADCTLAHEAAVAMLAQRQHVRHAELAAQRRHRLASSSGRQTNRVGSASPRK